MIWRDFSQQGRVAYAGWVQTKATPSLAQLLPCDAVVQIIVRGSHLLPMSLLQTSQTGGMTVRHEVVSGIPCPWTIMLLAGACC